MRWIHSVSHWIALVLISVALGTVQTATLVLNSPRLAPIATFVSYVLAFAIVFWAVADARRRRCVPCFDFGFLLLTTHPFGVIGYLLWTRRWKGFLLMAAFAGLYIVPWMCSVFVCVVVVILRRI